MVGLAASSSSTASFSSRFGNGQIAGAGGHGGGGKDAKVVVDTWVNEGVAPAPDQVTPEVLREVTERFKNQVSGKTISLFRFY
jgi:hypothetical protein